ncbi:MAG: cytochrome c4 [Gammaproteobacteria bacterium]|nr:cytochrome c4 [Gammaproteobacteria bacterium]|tara:strand:- start:2321 stop:2989 length:669 start_codon:yes stop_codon:yes gene_type:complete
MLNAKKKGDLLSKGKKQFAGRISISLVLIFILTGTISSSIAGDIEAGKQKSIVCSACHGQDGNSLNPLWPSLAGQHKQYTSNTLKAYLNGTRVNLVMQTQLMRLTEQDFDDIASYYNAQIMQKKDYDYELAKKGESLYRGGNSATGVAACIACHGPTGRGNPGAGYPSIAGQHAQYTEDALKQYKNSERKAVLNDMMQSLAARLTAEEIEAVSEYIQALGSK